jgi:predicted amidohydrolase
MTRVAAIQFKGQRADPVAARASLLESIQDALDWGAQLVVSPELACTQYLFSSRNEASLYAENYEGLLAQALKKLSTKYEAWLVVGFIEKALIEPPESPDPHLYNSALILSPSGASTTYRKRLLYMEDERWATPGEGPHAQWSAHVGPPPHPLNIDLTVEEKTKTEAPTASTILSTESDQDIEVKDPNPPYPLFEVNGLQMTVGICMDLNDPRFIAFCEAHQVELIAFPTNWIDEGHEVHSYWAHLLHRVSPATLIAANSYGREGDCQFRGESAILNISSYSLLAVAPSEGDHIIGVDLSPLYPSLTSQKNKP